MDQDDKEFTQLVDATQATLLAVTTLRSGWNSLTPDDRDHVLDALATRAAQMKEILFGRRQGVDLPPYLRR